MGTFQNSVVQPWKPAEEQRRVADEAIRNADLTQARIPTGYWAGGGLSRSMPESELKRIAKATRAGLGSGNVMVAVSESVDGRSSDSPRTSPALARVGSNSGKLQTGPSPTDRGRSGTPHGTPQRPDRSSPSSRSGTPTRPARHEGNGVVADYWNVANLDELLAKLGLLKYAAQFAEQEVDLATFLTLDDADLKEIGISTVGARRKLILAIGELQTMRTQGRGHFLVDMYRLRDGGKAGSPPRSTLLGGSPSSSLNGGLTGSFDSAGRRWSRTHGSGK